MSPSSNDSSKACLALALCECDPDPDAADDVPASVGDADGGLDEYEGLDDDDDADDVERVVSVLSTSSLYLSWEAPPPPESIVKPQSHEIPSKRRRKMACHPVQN